jgi:hypothetical protein
MHTVRVRVADARRIPHPSIPGVEKHYFLIRVAYFPSGIPLDANPRDAEGRDLNHRVYKQVEDSLFNRASEIGTFDLMNKGITVVAEKVTKLNDHEYELTFDEGQGITDGGHTTRLLEKNLNDETLPAEQHVEMRVITGVQQPLIADITKGLNTGMQVKPYAIENLRGRFDWMKEIIDGQPFGDLIAWRENEDKPYNVVDILCLLECVNVHNYPNDTPRHPVAAYDKTSQVINSFADDPERYRAYYREGHSPSTFIRNCDGCDPSVGNSLYQWTLPPNRNVSLVSKAEKGTTCRIRACKSGRGTMPSLPAIFATRSKRKLRGRSARLGARVKSSRSSSTFGSDFPAEERA